MKAVFVSLLILIFGQIIRIVTGQTTINPTDQQVLIEFYNGCSPNCPSQITTGNCSFVNTTVNQCDCNLSNVKVVCNSYGHVIQLDMYLPFFFLFLHLCGTYSLTFSMIVFEALLLCSMLFVAKLEKNSSDSVQLSRNLFNS